MRTTLTIDDDIAIQVQREVKRSGDTFKGTINRLLKQGLISSSKPEAEKPFVVHAYPLGIGAMLDRHNGKVSALLEELDGPEYR